MIIGDQLWIEVQKHAHHTHIHTYQVEERNAKAAAAKEAERQAAVAIEAERKAAVAKEAERKAAAAVVERMVNQRITNHNTRTRNYL